MPDRQIQAADTALKAAPLAYILTFLPVATNRDAGLRGFVTGDVAPFFSGTSYAFCRHRLV